MPLLSPEETVNIMGLNDHTGYPTPPERRPDMVQQGASMFRVENSLSSFIAWNDNRPGQMTQQEIDDFKSGAYNPLESLKDTQYDNEKYYPEITKIKSKREEMHFLQNAEREQADRKVISQMSTPGALAWGMVAGTLDPMIAPAILVPGVFAGATGRFLGTGGVAGALTGVAETSLHQTQVERELRESVYNIGGATLLAGVLGAAFGKKFSPQQKKEFIDALNTDPEFEMIGPRMPLIGTGVGSEVMPEIVKQFVPNKAYRAIMNDLDAGKISLPEAQRAMYHAWDDSTKLVNQALLRPFKIFHPGLRMAMSKLPGVRTTASQLVDDAYIKRYHEHGLGPNEQPVSISIHLSQDANGLYKVSDTMDRNYAAYLGTGKGIMNNLLPTGAIKQVMARRRQDLMTYDEFGEQTMRAVMDGAESADPHIKAAAGDVKAVIDRITKEQIEVGEIKLPEGVTELPPLHGDKGMYPRVYDMGEVINKPSDFVSTVAHGFVDYVKAKYPKVYDDIRNNLDEFTDQDWYDAMTIQAERYHQSIMKSPTGHVGMHGVTYKDGVLSEFLDGKQLDVSSLDLLNKGFLIKDLPASMFAYLRNVVPRIEITRRFGDVKMTEAKVALRQEQIEYVKARSQEKFGDDYIELKEDVDITDPLRMKQEKFEKKLTAKFNDELRTLDNMRRYMLHEYERPDDPGSFLNSTLNKIRAFNVLKGLGGMTLASLSDIGTAMMRVGAIPFTKSLVKFATGVSSVPRSEALKWSVGMDLVTNSRLNQIGMLDDVGMSKMDRLLGKATRGFSKATGMAQWNAVMKQLAGLSIADSIGKLATKANLTANDKKLLARAGINETMWQPIKAQLKLHQKNENGWLIPNDRLWTNKPARDAYVGAILRDADNAIVTPGPGDLPMMSYGQLGKMLFQFKTFMFAVQNRAILPGLQQANTDSIIGLTSMLGLGMASYMLKQHAAGKDTSGITSDQLFKEGIAQSGMTGVLFGFDTMLHDITGGEVSAQGAIWDDLPVSRSMSQSLVNNVIGPWYGTLQDTKQAVSGAAKSIVGGEVLPNDVAAGRRLLPTQNLFYLRQGWNELETALGGREFD